MCLDKQKASSCHPHPGVRLWNTDILGNPTVRYRKNCEIINLIAICNVMPINRLKIMFGKALINYKRNIFYKRIFKNYLQLLYKFEKEKCNWILLCSYIQ